MTDLKFTKIGLSLINVQKIVLQNFTVIKFNSFQRKSINTLRYAIMSGECLHA